MQLSFRTKLMAIAGTAGLSFVVLIAAQTMLTGRMQRQLASIQRRYIPLIEIGHRLETGFEGLRRAFLDSVAAQDKEGITRAHGLREELLAEVEHAREVVEPARITELGAAIRDYDDTASNVSGRLIGGETGVALPAAMARMQTQQARVERLLKDSFTLDRSNLTGAFASIEQSQQTSGRMLLWISTICLAAVSLLSLVLGRSAIRALDALMVGLRQFGQGQLSEPIVVKSRDEIGEVALEANRMAIRMLGLMKDLESFSYSVAHDLRAPLRSILGYGNIVLEDHRAQLPADAIPLLERVVAAAGRMGVLIDGLLGLSRLARAEVRKEQVDLSAIVGEITADLRAAAPARHVELRIQPGLTARGDAGLLRIVLTNLLSNAWKFSSKTREARIEFGAEDRREGRQYYIRDNGAGFDMQYAGKLFGTFQRLHSESEFEGTGIGLATVQTIVRRHGGEIRAEGKPGAGAVFYFSLEKPWSENKGEAYVPRNDLAGGRQPG